MNKILSYYEELFDSLPKTWKARQIRIQMQNNSIDQYEALVKLGLTKKEAYSQTISSIPSVNQIAKYIPVRLVDLSFVKAIVSLLLYIFCYTETKSNTFLQIFYPVIFDFPHIIRNSLLYVLFTFVMFYLLKQGHKFLLKKYTNQNSILEIAFKVSAMLMLTIYICSAVIFTFFSLCGYKIDSLSNDITFKVLYWFFKYVISNLSVTLLYASITAALFLLAEGNLQETRIYLPNSKSDIDEFQRPYIEKTIANVVKGGKNDIVEETIEEDDLPLENVLQLDNDLQSDNDLQLDDNSLNKNEDSDESLDSDAKDEEISQEEEDIDTIEETDQEILDEIISIFDEEDMSDYENIEESSDNDIGVEVEDEDIEIESYDQEDIPLQFDNDLPIENQDNDEDDIIIIKEENVVEDIQDDISLESDEEVTQEDIPLQFDNDSPIEDQDNDDDDIIIEEEEDNIKEDTQENTTLSTNNDELSNSDEKINNADVEEDIPLESIEDSSTDNHDIDDDDIILLEDDNVAEDTQENTAFHSDNDEPPNEEIKDEAVQANISLESIKDSSIENHDINDDGKDEDNTIKDIQLD